MSVLEPSEREFTSAQYSGWEDQLAAQLEREYRRRDRQSLLNAVDMFCVREVRAGNITQYNAWRNLSDMAGQWTTEAISTLITRR